jgi:hypothetical protein
MQKRPIRNNMEKAYLGGSYAGGEGLPVIGNSKNLSPNSKLKMNKAARERSKYNQSL